MNSTLLIIILIGAIAFILFLIFYLYFGRKPQIYLKLIDRAENIVLDFSEIQKNIPIAMFELSNKRKFISNRKIKTEFILKFQCLFEKVDIQENILPDESSDSLITIKSHNGRKTPPITFTIKNGKIKKNILMKAVVGTKLHFLLHPEILKESIPENFKDKKIRFELKLKDFETDFYEGKKKSDIIEYIDEPVERFIFDLVIPKKAKIEIRTEARKKSGNKGLQFIMEEERYTIPYTVNKPIRKLFKFAIANENPYKIIPPVKGEISLKVYEGLTSRRYRDIFYLNRSDSWDGQNAVQKVDISLNYNKELMVYCYVKYDEMGKNPEKKRDFKLTLQFHGEDNELIKEVSHILSITPSREKTEPVIQIFAPGEAPPDIESVHKEREKKTNSLIISIDDEDKLSSHFDVPLSNLDPIKIKEYNNTELFILRLGNRCNTGSGYYEWKISSPFLVENDYVKQKGGAVTVDYREGKIEDNLSCTQEVVFLLHPEKVEIRKFKINLELKFELTIKFFPEGKSTRQEILKYGDFTVIISGEHNTAPDYLVIDFGTTSIAVDHCPYTLEPDKQKYREPLRLESRKGLEESENGLLPSIMNIREGEKIGDENFVDLPAQKDILKVHSEWLITEVKLMLLDGCDEMAVPNGFNFIDEDGVHQEGGYMNLGSLIKSAHKTLKTNYISKLVDNYRKIIVTYPNSYNVTHKEFLQEIIKEAFEDEEKSIYGENIELVSESNAALFYYLKHRAIQRKDKYQENIIICDIGGGTMDISQAEVTWKKGKPYPARIEIKKRDGIAFAGEKLDTAIALQVHQILEEYNQNISYPYKKEKKLNNVTGKDLMFEESPDSTDIEISTSGDSSSSKIDFYFNKIARKKDESKNDNPKSNSTLREIMFKFKFSHILNFKKEIDQAKLENEVKICLGENTTDKGLCYTPQKQHELLIKIRGNSYQSKIKTIDKKLYLFIKKKDWLKLPYLERFKNLFKEKIKLFIGFDEQNIPYDGKIILFGRTSLWPAIPDVVNDIFQKKPGEIWLNEKEEDKEKKPDKKALKLKRAVVDGCLQKATDWSHIDFQDTDHTGLPAIYHKINPDTWEAKVLITDENGGPTPVDLNNSNFFQLGIKSAMGFSPYLGGNCFERDNFCKEIMEIELYLKKSKNRRNKIGYDFYIGSDRYKKRLKKLQLNTSRGGNLSSPSGPRWPINDPKLDDVDPDVFK